MKFADKYELFEAVTSGPVETFVARDVSSGERVLIHVFECQEQRRDEPIGRWVADSLRALAPKPPGSVVEAGGYGDTPYVYLVTKLPGDDALQKWVQQYEAHLEETQEITMAPVPASRPPRDPPIQAEPNPSGEFTRLFQAPEGSPRSVSDSGFTLPAQSPAASLQTDPSLGGFKLGDTHGTTPSPANKSGDTFANLFGSVDKQVADKAPQPAENLKPGEFTRFFKGPFSGEQPAATPDLLPPPLPAPEKRPGEFTALFGPGQRAGSSTPSNNTATTTPLVDPPMGGERQASSGSFEVREPRPQSSTIFEPPKSREDTIVNSATSPLVREPVWDSTTAVPKITIVPPPPPRATMPPSIPVPPESVAVKAPAQPERSTAGGSEAARATGVLGSVQDSGGRPSPVRGGPSDYTMIISGGTRVPAPPDEALKSEGKSAPGFGMPSAAPFPPAPKFPAAPQAPKVSPPPISAAPAGGKAPQATAQPTGPASYLPLILILTVLFFLGALLVLYFVLRH